MSANSAARAARFIFRPISAASAGGVSGFTALAHRIPNAVLAAAAFRRHKSELVPTRRAFLVDTLALVRGMEAQGIESKHADAITSAISVVLNDSLENVTESFVSKGEMQKREMIHDANLSKLKSEVQSSQVLHLEIQDASSQDHHFSLLQRATEKLRGDTDLLYWRIHHELTKQNAEASDRIIKQNAEASDRIIKQIAEACDRITKQIAEAGDQITKQIAEVGDQITKQIAEVGDQITKRPDYQA